MDRDNVRLIVKRRVGEMPGSCSVIRGPSARQRCIFYLSGPLRLPVNAALRGTINVLLRGGERNIQLDMQAVPDIDAAGIGELVHIYNVATATGAVFQVVGATPRVRRILETVGLFDILSKGERTAITSMAH